MPQHKIISKKLQQEITAFFEYAPPMRLSRNLRNMLMGYLLAYDDGYGIEIKDLLTDLSALFDLLDVAHDELGGL